MTHTPSLLPREHGAYAELAFPLVTGLALASPSVDALALAVAGILFFLANEPVAILLGVRGGRRLEAFAARARTRAGVLMGIGALLGALGLAGAGSAVWPEVLAPLLAGALLVPVVLMGRQKSLVGEFLVLTAFSTFLLPLAAASGADPRRALAATSVWWVSFALGTLEVHAIKARLKERAKNNWTRWGSPLASGLTVCSSLALALGFFHWERAPFLAGFAVAVLPPALVILALGLFRVHPRFLKRVGWTLVGANSLALGILLMG